MKRGSIYLAEFEGSHATSLPTQQYELNGLHNSPKLMLCELQMVRQLYFALNSSHFRVICQNSVPLDAPTFYSWYCLRSSLYLLMPCIFSPFIQAHSCNLPYIFRYHPPKKAPKVWPNSKTLHAAQNVEPPPPAFPAFPTWMSQEVTKWLGSVGYKPNKKPHL